MQFAVHSAISAMTPGPATCFPAEDDSEHHFTCDVRNLLDRLSWSWDLMIAHPPCTHLAVSGARWFKGKERRPKPWTSFAS